MYWVTSVRTEKWNYKTWYMNPNFKKVERGMNSNLVEPEKKEDKRKEKEGIKAETIN